jgi:serine/threonine protein kinase
MQGGRVIGEGVDGCIITEPMWPCSANSIKSGIPPLKSDGYVSKITRIDDEESMFRMAAQEILGPLATKYLTILQSECLPTNATHPPVRSQVNLYKDGKTSLMAWQPKEHACGELKNLIKKGKSITEDHKIMYISRYDMSVKDWLGESKDSMTQVIQKVLPAVREFIEVLQMLHQGSRQQLIHLDLHIGNIFVKQHPIQFGLTDFGQCLLRRSSDRPEEQAKLYLGHYLCQYIDKYDLVKLYRQVPFEARLLNFCYRKNLEKVSPGTLLKLWEQEIQSIQADSEDFIIMEANVMIKNLLKKPLFISMIETLQQISKKLRLNPDDKVKIVQSLN